MADDRHGSRHVLGEPRQCNAGATSVVVRGLDRPLSGDEIKTASVADGSDCVVGWSFRSATPRQSRASASLAVLGDDHSKQFDQDQPLTGSEDFELRAPG